MKLVQPRPKLGTMTLEIPGPDRKRNLAAYSYRVAYRSPDPDATGCVSVWEVEGGRLPYQVALERTDRATLRWHCTCADAVYRGDKDERRQCKHVQGLLECLPPLN